MLPYRAPEIKAKPAPVPRLKPIPSLEFVHSMTILCEGSDNSYDVKNHVLVINDLAAFEYTARNKMGRSFKAIERQLKMLGFKLKRSRYSYE